MADPGPITTQTLSDAQGGAQRGTLRVLRAPAVLVGSLAALAGGIYYAVATRPKVDVGELLADSAALVEQGKFEEALEDLNLRVLPVVNAGQGTPREVGEFFLMRARSLYEAAAAAGVSREENYRAVVDDYAAARKHGVKLGTPDVVRLATARLEQGQIDEGLKEGANLPTSEGEARRRLVKLAVTRSLRDPKTRFEQTLGLLVELAQQPGLSGEDAAWALTRQGELLLGVGRPKEAIAKLLREMQMLRDVSQAQEAEMECLLGRAYYEDGELGEAARQLERAIGLMEPAVAARGRAIVLLGQIRQATGQLDEARELFSSALEMGSDSPAYLPALMGRASVIAVQGNDEGALADYAELIERLPHAAHARELTPDVIADGLMARHGDRITAGRTREALRYALLAESLYPADRTPASILLALAVANRRLADDLMGRGGVGAEESEAPAPKTDPRETGRGMDAVTREQAKRGYLAAGVYYGRHAGEVVVEDAESAILSRWMSADSFDLAGDVEEATKAFSAYLQGAPGDDARRQEAKFRLAQVFQSVGDFGTAAALYRELLDERQSAADRGGMLWADRSIVPLAQCTLADGDKVNDAEAERQLQSILGGRQFSPQAEEFRAALMELGRYYYASGRYAPAIERLREAVVRYPSDPEVERVRFRLADSLRLSAGELGRMLQQAMPQAQRQELEKTRHERLREAMMLFEKVKAALTARGPETLDRVEEIHLRNSMFYLGDCAFELGEHEDAIAYYDAARQRYDSDPASLVALVQIVNAYVRQGQWAKAITANERARQHLAKFPENVWADPNLPMDKRHWERWLDSRSLLEQHARAAAAGSDGVTDRK